jgi:hypothetical protein
MISPMISPFRITAQIQVRNKFLATRDAFSMSRKSATFSRFFVVMKSTRLFTILPIIS